MGRRPVIWEVEIVRMVPIPVKYHPTIPVKRKPINAYQDRHPFLLSLKTVQVFQAHPVIR
jgi:hypothetical protein